MTLATGKVQLLDFELIGRWEPDDSRALQKDLPSCLGEYKIFFFFNETFFGLFGLKYIGSAGSLQNMALGAQSVTALIVVGPEFSHTPPSPPPIFTTSPAIPFQHIPMLLGTP